MSLLECLKFWSKFYRIPLFWNTVSEYPPPPENENCQRSWHFDFSVSEYPPPNWNLARSWHFDFSVSEYPPPPKIEFRQILALWLFSFRIPPPPPKRLRLRFFSFRITGTNGKLCVASYHMWRLYPARITTRLIIRDCFFCPVSQWNGKSYWISW